MKNTITTKTTYLIISHESKGINQNGISSEVRTTKNDHINSYIHTEIPLIISHLGHKEDN